MSCLGVEINAKIVVIIGQMIGYRWGNLKMIIQSTHFWLEEYFSHHFLKNGLYWAFSVLDLMIWFILQDIGVLILYERTCF